MRFCSSSETSELKPSNSGIGIRAVTFKWSITKLQRIARTHQDGWMRSLTAPKVPKTSPAAPEDAHAAHLRCQGQMRLPMPGSIITRRYKGDTLQVKVLPQGFEYEGEIYKSLSAVAKQISGSH